ncbi:DUF5615 family PIN-like protein [Sphingomonas adhaesiva]|uniref:DUF5615 family PIN-like protein n=1 Tax=Sphingomonas adhaesiva TaxID=28212 RepID=UPI002FF82E7F
MRFLVDAQLPPALCRWLETRGHDAYHVGTELPGATPDHAVAAYAVDHACILLTKDEDFLTRHPPGEYALVWLRIGNATNRSLLLWLEPRWAAIIAALDAGERLIEVR